LVRDGKRPAAPGRLIAASSDLNATGATPAECAAFKRALLIHAGDSVIAEEHTGSVDARLEAIALTGAAAGDQLTVRLKIGGRIFRARAIAPGRAVMLASREARP
jgi:flagella basal body P-ring formation protein FlgA